MMVAVRGHPIQRATVVRLAWVSAQVHRQHEPGEQHDKDREAGPTQPHGLAPYRTPAHGVN
jgi:hypothetical protein